MLGLLIQQLPVGLLGAGTIAAGGAANGQIKSHLEIIWQGGGQAGVEFQGQARLAQLGPEHAQVAQQVDGGGLERQTPLRRRCRQFGLPGHPPPGAEVEPGANVPRIKRHGTPTGGDRLRCPAGSGQGHRQVEVHGGVGGVEGHRLVMGGDRRLALAQISQGHAQAGGDRGELGRLAAGLARGQQALQQRLIHRHRLSLVALQVAAESQIDGALHVAGMVRQQLPVHLFRLGEGAGETQGVAAVEQGNGVGGVEGEGALQVGQGLSEVLAPQGDGAEVAPHHRVVALGFDPAVVAGLGRLKVAGEVLIHNGLQGGGQGLLPIARQGLGGGAGSLSGSFGSLAEPLLSCHGCPACERIIAESAFNVAVTTCWIFNADPLVRGERHPVASQRV